MGGWDPRAGGEEECLTTAGLSARPTCAQVRQQMMNSMAEEMSYGAMGGYVAHAEDGGHGGGDGGGDAPMRFDRGDSDDER